MRKGHAKCILVLLLILAIVFIGCGVVSASDSNQKTIEKSRIELVNEQLQGTWISIDAENFYSKWSFLNGYYVCESYLDEKLMENPTLGVYVIGTEAIYTLTIDQDNRVEGSIPYVFENGTLTLLPQNDAEITKDK